jgi:hypothetical protein
MRGDTYNRHPQPRLVFDWMMIVASFAFVLGLVLGPS